MPLVISDELLEQMHLTDREARVEIACIFFDVGKLALWPAAQFAGLSRIEMEDALTQRRISIYRPTLDEFDAELASLRGIENKSVAR